MDESQLKPVALFRTYHLSIFMLYVVPSYLCSAPPLPSPSVGLAGSQRHCSLLIVLEPSDSLMQLSVTKSKVTIQFTWYWSKFSFLYMTLFPDLTGICPSLTSPPLQACVGWLPSWTAKTPAESSSQCMLVSCMASLPWAAVTDLQKSLLNRITTQLRMLQAAWSCE